MESETSGAMLIRRWPQLVGALVTGPVFMLASCQPDVTFEGIALWPSC
jgi:hypothetical protein